MHDLYVRDVHSYNHLNTKVGCQFCGAPEHGRKPQYRHTHAYQPRGRGYPAKCECGAFWPPRAGDTTEVAQ